MKRILVIGGGAAGLAAAIQAAERRPGAEITVVERLDRVGKKLLSTGNGRCNLTNLEAGAERYLSGRPEILAEILGENTPERVLSFFGSLGLLCQEEEAGRVYPYCRQAAMVLDVLLAALSRRNIRTLCGWRAAGLSRQGKKFVLTGQDGRQLEGDRVILAAGGRAAPKLGSDGSGFDLARQMGHSCAPVYPALAPLRCGKDSPGGLKGLRAHAALTLKLGGRTAGKDAGEVQFTEYGLSGIPVMNLSGRLARREKGERAVLLLDLFPRLSREELRRLLEERRRLFPAETLETLLMGTIPKRLAFALMKACGLQPLSRRNDSLTGGELDTLAAGGKGWAFSVEGPMGWDQAQVTGGGVPLEEIDPRTMESRRCPGLYLAGEVLDAAGECGGFNLHWAWVTGLLAGASAAGEEMI